MGFAKTITNLRNPTRRLIRIGLTLVCLAGPAAEPATAHHSQSVLHNQLGRPLAVSHRGCMVECPENTLEAFSWARKVGADAIEIDLRATADDHLVVIHDKTVDRTTDGRGAVHRLTLAEIRELDAGDGQRVPTMDEAFAFAHQHDLHVLVDIKDVKRVDPARVVSAIHRHGISDKAVIGTRSVRILREVTRLDDNLVTLAFPKKEDLIDAYLEEGVDIVRLWAEWVQREPKLVDYVRSNDTRVWVTAGDLRGCALDTVMQHDVQAVITDFPREVMNTSC